MAVNTTHVRSFNLRNAVARVPRSALSFILTFSALVFFEIFNFSTTDFALRDLLGGSSFAGIPWATILSLAFCGIDFAGVARLLSPRQVKTEPKESWYLFGAWLIAATMNTVLTWWGVSLAIVNHSTASSAVVAPNTLLKVVPVFVAIMVWVIRILIIGSFSYTLDRLMKADRIEEAIITPKRANMSFPRDTAAHYASHPMARSSSSEPTRENI